MRGYVEAMENAREGASHEEIMQELMRPIADAAQRAKDKEEGQ